MTAVEPGRVGLLMYYLNTPVELSRSSIPNKISQAPSICTQVCHIFFTFNHMLYFQFQDANYATTVDNPCGNKGYELNLTDQYLWEKQPCIQGAFAKSFLGESIPAGSPSGKQGYTEFVRG